MIGRPAGTGIFLLAASLAFAAHVSSQSSEGVRVLELINQERARVGVHPLIIHPALQKASQDYANLMALTGHWGHTGPDGSTPWSRMAAAGYTGQTMGENIARGYGTPEAVVSAWMNSPGHRTNILHREFKEIGVGIAVSASGVQDWVTDFGARSTTTPDPLPSPPPPVPVPSPPPPEPVPDPPVDTFYVSTAGNDASEGSITRPWRSIAKAAAAARGGQTILIRAGTYRESLAPAAGGTGEGSRITFRAYPGETVVLDGGTERLTGWTQESGGIYRRPFSGTLHGLFQEEPNAVTAHAVLWDMGRVNLYDSNPGLDLHGYDPGHDDFQFAGKVYPKHDQFSQYKLANGVLRVHTKDGRSPDLHPVHGARLAAGLDLRGKSYVSVEGIRFQRYRNGAFLQGSHNLRLTNCEFLLSSHTGMWIDGCQSLQARRVTVRGAGSWMGHYEECVMLDNSHDSAWEECDFSFGGHSGFFLRGSDRTQFRRSVVRDCGGSLMTMYYGCDNGRFEESIFARGATIALSRCHKVPHAALQLAGGSGNLFVRNTYIRSGFGVVLSCDERQVTNDNRFDHNTIAGNEWDGIQLQGYSREFGGRLNANQFRNNVAAANGVAPLRIELPGGPPRSDFWGNRFEALLAYPQPLQIFEVGAVGVADAERRWPGTFSRLIAADPLFVNAAGDDYRLQPGSPAIDRGVNIGLPYQGAAPDLGAFEAAAAPPPAPEPAPVPGAPVLASISPNPAGVLAYVTLRGSGFSSQATVVFTAGDGTLIRARTIYVTDTAIVAQVPITAGSGPVYVRRLVDSSLSNRLFFTLWRP